MTEERLVYVCSPNKHAELTREITWQIENCAQDGRKFRVLSAITHTPQDMGPRAIFQRNRDLIAQAPYFLAVLKDYGKDLAAGVGLAFGSGRIMAALDYGADQADIMVYFAFDDDRMLKPYDLTNLIYRWLS